jgi:hypothetical protein
MAEAAGARTAGDALTLVSLCDEATFDRYIDTVAGALADRFTLRVNKNIVTRRMAFTAWIIGLARVSRPEIDYRSFVAVCATMIDTVARHRTLSFSALVRDPNDEMIGVVLKYPNEVTALTAGTVLYDRLVSGLTGAPAYEPPSPMVLQNAAASLAAQPKAAAARFRELLRLSTPWS